MKILSKVALAGVIMLAVGYGGSQWILHSRAPDTTLIPLPNLTDDKLIQQGAYVSRTGDCVACHTTPGGKPYAGGLAMQTPLGAIYSTNITPDPQTGIGDYSYAEFKAAVQHGVRKDKAALYPAMPYPSYAIMPEEEIRALYAYFMKGVEPVQQVNAEPTLPKIFQMRWTVAWWQLLFSPTDRQFEPIPAETDQLINRGKYLVEGPGHCGACHTPRGIAYQELALNLNQGDEFLSGAVIDGWRAKSLRGGDRGLAEWTEDELIEFFATGRTDKVAAFGAMADVIEHSTQYMTVDDQTAMSRYLKSLSGVKGRPHDRPTKEDSTTELLLTGKYNSAGALLYAEHCITCHRADGKGLPRIFPALANNSAVFANNAQSVIQVTLEGGKMPKTAADTMAFTMPSFRFLSDEEVRDVVNFIRNSWDNISPEVSVKDVAHIRKFVANKAPNIVVGANHE